jgi:gentisate 1,2-dioxygenase
LWQAPRKTFLPAHWAWRDGKAALDAAGRLISTELAERRNLILFNPVEGNSYATVRTLINAYQMILPGEIARSHRHTGNALRFILEGEGSYTVVQGARLEMHPNDVLLTPNWQWHGHGSDADGPCYWLDCLDVPLVHLLEPMFFEPHPAGFETEVVAPGDSPFIFPWASVQASLDRASPDPGDRHGRRVELGSPALDSIALYMQRHDGGSRTRRFRTTVNHVYCVVEGRGATFIDGAALQWQRGDVIAVPSWRPFEHRFDADSTLFCMTDAPVFRAFKWERSEDV